MIISKLPSIVCNLVATVCLLCCGLTAYAQTGNIVFEDEHVKAICVAKWDTDNDGELSYAEAKSVTELDGAFSNNTAITCFNELQYFTGLTEIYYSAFKGCTSLSSVVLPASITSIGMYAFETTGLTSIVIPASVETIDMYSFFMCEKLASLSFSAGSKLKEIGVFAFNRAKIENLSLPSRLETVGKFAFHYCPLKYVDIPATVTSIGEDAFNADADDGDITNPVMSVYVRGNTPATLGTDAFGRTAPEDLGRINAETTIHTSYADQYRAAWSQYADYVRERQGYTVSIGGVFLNSALIADDGSVNYKDANTEISGVTVEINGDNYISCINLNNAVIKTTANNGIYSDRTNCDRGIDIYLKGHNIIEAAQTGIAFCGDLNISTPEDALGMASLDIKAPQYGIKGLSPNNSNPQTLYLYNCLIDINCTNGPCIEGSNSQYMSGYETVLGMGENLQLRAKTNASSPVITTINLDSYMEFVDFISPEDARLSNPDDGVWGVVDADGQLVCGEVRVGGYINFQDANVEKICVSKWDADKNRHLDYFEAADVSSLDGAFKGNEDIVSFDELQHFTGLTEIEDDAFNGCSALESVVLPSTIVSIGLSAFQETALKEITIPKSVGELGEYTFRKCPSLTTVEFEEGSTINTIPTGMCLDCSTLREVIVSNTITKLNSNAFMRCPYFLPNAILNQNPITYIDWYVFQGCANDYVTIPTTVEFIGNYAFYGCNTVVFDDPENSNLYNIGEEAFFQCSEIASALPASLTNIGDRAFGYDKETAGPDFYAIRESIEVLSETPPTIGVDCFGKLEDKPIFVPEGCESSYLLAWSDYKDYIYVPEGADIVTGMNAVESDATDSRHTGVWTLDGRRLRSAATLTGLPSDIYLLHGRKVVVK